MTEGLSSFSFTETDLPLMVREFQAKFNIPSAEFKPTYLYERFNMLAEEMDEIAKAIALEDKAQFLDGLVDLVYFAIGTSTALSFDFNEAFRRVHEANMKKVRAYTERTAFDLVKPPGWKPADLSDLV